MAVDQASDISDASEETTRTPVTADDVQHVVRLALTALRAGLGADWDTRAGALEWTCWETVEHLADDLFAYAAQLGPESPALDGDVPFDWRTRRAGGPANITFADRAAGLRGLLLMLDACGGMLTSMVRTAPAEARAYHIFGTSDAEGFAAMGVVETLVHTHDVAQGLGLPWSPPAGLCGRALARLFPCAPADTDRWQTLLWATGRGELPGRGRLESWRWYSAVAR
ncbi:hypothetical protein AB0J25_00955 [Streptomyces sp. NPDC049910]|uniref:hypothetical protein n=1 Tax=Streptomyces sp. NPDC049910 TaxID=3155278 RepID=UPI0034163DD5